MPVDEQPRQTPQTAAARGDHSAPARPESVQRSEGLRNALVAAVVFVFMAGIYFGSPRVRVGDSKYVLLISEHFLHAGNLAVDEHFWPYVDSSDYPKVQPGEYYPRHFRRFGGHLYPLYGPGAPVLSVPFVAAMKWLFGESVIDTGNRYVFEVEKQWQKRLAAVATAAACVLFFLTARLLLSTGWSFLVAVSGGLATQLWSTASRAASAQTFTVLLLSLVFFLILRSAATARPIRPVVLGTLLSWCFFVRPTAAMFIAPLTVYLFLSDRKRGTWLVVTGATWLGLFVLWSLATYGTILPVYYLAHNDLSLSNLPIGLAGQLISPSRGFFVFVPAVLFVFYLVATRWPGLPFKPLAAAILGAVLLHILGMASYSNWWGGSAYGPRLHTGLVPHVVVLGILAAAAPLRTGRKKLLSKAEAAVLTVCLLFGALARIMQEI